MINASNRSRKEAIKKLFNSSPLIIRKSYSLAYSIWRGLRAFWLPEHTFAGRAREGNSSLKFSYFGWDEKVLNYWLGRIFDQYKKLPGNKPVPVRKLNRYLKENPSASDMAVVELATKRAKKYSEELYGFVLPRWVKMHLETDVSMSILMKKRNSIMRRVKKYSLKVEKGTSDQDFAFFYEKMYKPHIENRHKESVVVMDYRSMFNEFQREDSTIYFVVEDGVRIGGLYEQKYKGIPYLHSVGVLDGSEDRMRHGAIGAAYYFAIADHHKNNIKRINLGGTSPFLKDGLTAFKLSLGAKVSGLKRQDSLRLKLLSLKSSQATKDFFTSNLFAFVENEALYCAVFKVSIPAKPSEEFLKLKERILFMTGQNPKVFYFNAQNELTEISPY